MTEVFATDADSGDNGDVGFEIVGYEPDVESGQLFNVDPETGFIRCYRELDRETLDRYVIKVTKCFLGLFWFITMANKCR